MARIRTSNTTTGRPGFSRGALRARFTGKRVSKGVSAKSGVRRLIARDPAKGRSGLIGTKQDIQGFSNVLPNTTAAPRPRIIKAPNFKKGNATMSGVKKVFNRSANRSITKR